MDLGRAVNLDKWAASLAAIHRPSFGAKATSSHPRRSRSRMNAAAPMVTTSWPKHRATYLLEMFELEPTAAAASSGIGQCPQST